MKPAQEIIIDVYNQWMEDFRNNDPDALYWSDDSQTRKRKIKTSYGMLVLNFTNPKNVKSIGKISGSIPNKVKFHFTLHMTTYWTSINDKYIQKRYNKAEYTKYFPIECEKIDPDFDFEELLVDLMLRK